MSVLVCVLFTSLACGCQHLEMLSPFLFYLLLGESGAYINVFFLLFSSFRIYEMSLNIGCHLSLFLDVFFMYLSFYEIFS